MRLEIKVGPPLLTISQGYTVMVSDTDGQVPSNDVKGLYFLDTRLISMWRLYADGSNWKLLSGGSPASSVAFVYFTNPAILTESGLIPENTLGLTFGRRIDGGMHEDIQITNYGTKRRKFNLEVVIRSDFADLFEVKANKVTRRGKINTDWSAETQSLTTSYRNGDFHRALRVTAAEQRSNMSYANGRLSFCVDVRAGAIWRASLLYDFADGQNWSNAPLRSVGDYLNSKALHAQRQWQARVLKVETPNEDFAKAFAQAVDDMSALRLPIEGTSHTQFVPAAGLPWFNALFGRDALIISLQTAIVHPEFALGALLVLARLQADECDDFTDAEPGKILHELRRGELAHFKIVPHTPYYGSADATPLYLVTMHSAWMCTGDRAVLDAHLDTAERCLEWIDKYGDRDGDGFQEYQTRSSAGYENQGWKDSSDSVMNADGSPVKGPKALCELQGYVYDAWVRMAQIFDYLGRGTDAKNLRGKAADLFSRFNEAFWLEEEGFYSYALDADKNQVKSIASNPGHCLWSGIVPHDRARRVADRLMQPDMSSGWGIRTLSADHVSFNPFNYQTGSVWPHDNGILAQGMKRYGLGREACSIAGSICQAGRYFSLYQMPELYAGTERDGSSFPVPYLAANVPQGWAAGSVFSVLQAMLGFQPDAPNGKLYFDPTLPDWLPRLIVRDLRIGSMAFDIKFQLEGGTTEFEVLRGARDAVLRRPMVEWAKDLQAGSELKNVDEMNEG